MYVCMSKADRAEHGTAPGVLLEDDLLVGVGFEKTRLAQKTSDLVRHLLSDLL